LSHRQNFRRGRRNIGDIIVDESRYDSSYYANKVEQLRKFVQDNGGNLIDFGLSTKFGSVKRLWDSATSTLIDNFAYQPYGDVSNSERNTDYRPSRDKLGPRDIPTMKELYKTAFKAVKSAYSIYNDPKYIDFSLPDVIDPETRDSPSLLKKFILKGFLPHSLPFSERADHGDQELKSHIAALSYSNQNLGVVNDITVLIPQGYDIYQRIGRQIFLVSLELTMYYTMSSSGSPVDTNELTRICVIYDLQPKPQFISTEPKDLLDVVIPTAFNNLANRDRYLWLFDKSFNLNSVSTTNVIFQHYIDLKGLKVVYNFNDYVGFGALLFFTITDSVNNPKISIFSRIRYKN